MSLEFEIILHSRRNFSEERITLMLAEIAKLFCLDFSYTLNCVFAGYVFCAMFYLQALYQYSFESFCIVVVSATLQFTTSSRI